MANSIEEEPILTEEPQDANDDQPPAIFRTRRRILVILCLSFACTVVALVWISGTAIGLHGLHTEAGTARADELSPATPLLLTTPPPPLAASPLSADLQASVPLAAPHRPPLPPLPRPPSSLVEDIRSWSSRFSPLPQSVESIGRVHDPLMGESTVMWKPADPGDGAAASNAPDRSSSNV